MLYIYIYTSVQQVRMRLREGGSAPKRGRHSATALFQPTASAQWQPDGLTIPSGCRNSPISIVIVIITSITIAIINNSIVVIITIVVVTVVAMVIPQWFPGAGFLGAPPISPRASRPRPPTLLL